MTILLTKTDIHSVPKPNVFTLVQDSTLPDRSLITAALSLIFDGDRLLLTKINHRGWDFPGGHLEPGESAEEAVRREIYEETAARVKGLRLFAYEKFVIHGPVPSDYKYPYPISYQVFYLGFLDKLEPFKPTEEAGGRKLFSPDELKHKDWRTRGPFLYETALAYVSNKVEK